MNLLGLAAASDGLKHKGEIKKYCERRIQQIEEAKPYLEAYSVVGLGVSFNPLTLAKQQIEVLNAILEELDNSNSDELKAQNVKHLASLHSLQPFGRDVIAILNDREAELPRELKDIPKFLLHERAEWERQRVQREQEYRDRREAEKQAGIEAERKWKRAELEAQIGAL